MKRILYGLLTIAIVVFTAMPAFAAEEIVTQAEATTITANFTEILTFVIPILTTIVSAVVLLLGRWILKKIGLEGIIADDKLKEQVDKLAADAAAYGVSKVGNAKWTSIETKNKVLGFAINYTNDHGPALLEKAGFDSAKIKQKLEAKINSYDPTTANPAPTTVAK